MGRVHIVTDNTVQFTFSGVVEKYPVTVVTPSDPQGESSPSQSEDDNFQKLRHLFRDPHTAPTPRSPTADQFAKTYEEIRAHTDEIVSIHTSPAVSQAAENALAASQMYLGRSNIEVIDSKMVSVGLGLLVQEAAAASARDEGIDEIVRIVRSMSQRLYGVFFLEDLMYLERNGLTSRSQAILGNMLGIIPFLTMEQGRIIPMEKVRSRSRALEKLHEFVSEFSNLDYIAMLQDGNTPRSATLAVAERLHVLFPSTPITITGYNLALASFLGLNGLGVVVLEAEDDQI